MKCQSKIAVSISNPLGGVDYILIKGKMYECELTPTAITLRPSKRSYIVTCEDGNFRTYDVEYFKGIVEVREEKLKELGI